VSRSLRRLQVGALRPAIVLYGEDQRHTDDISDAKIYDCGRKPDMLIVMGTSLKVTGIKKLVKDFSKVVHSSKTKNSKGLEHKVVFVNRTPPDSSWNGSIDYHVEGDTDDWVDMVLKDWKKMRPGDWEIQQTLVAVDGNIKTSGKLKVVRAVSGVTGKNKVKGVYASVIGVAQSSYDI
jgi:NAD-dependent histone deacetylase SIR2